MRKKERKKKLLLVSATNSGAERFLCSFSLTVTRSLTRFRPFPPPKSLKIFFCVCFRDEKRPENVAFWHSMVGSIQQEFYFFLPKKLNLFSRSFSLPSLARMVTAPASPEPGEMGGMVMARLRPRGPPGDSPEPDGMEARMEVIQEVISAWTHKSCLHSPSRCIDVCTDMLSVVSPADFRGTLHFTAHPHFFTKNTIETIAKG